MCTKLKLVHPIAKLLNDVINDQKAHEDRIRQALEKFIALINKNLSSKSNSKQMVYFKLDLDVLVAAQDQKLPFNIPLFCSALRRGYSGKTNDFKKRSKNQSTSRTKLMTYEVEVFGPYRINEMIENLIIKMLGKDNLFINKINGTNLFLPALTSEEHVFLAIHYMLKAFGMAQQDYINQRYIVNHLEDMISGSQTSVSTAYTCSSQQLDFSQLQSVNKDSLANFVLTPIHHLKNEMAHSNIFGQVIEKSHIQSSNSINYFTFVLGSDGKTIQINCSGSLCNLFNDIELRYYYLITDAIVEKYNSTDNQKKFRIKIITRNQIKRVEDKELSDEENLDDEDDTDDQSSDQIDDVNNDEYTNL